MPTQPLSAHNKKSLKESLQALLNPKVINMLFLGFSAGLPILLIFSSLSLWLREAGVERSAVTYFSWAALGYSFKFVWAPLVDRLPLPVLDNLLGRRRSWLLLSQLCIALAISAMALNDPQESLAYMAIFAVLLGFSSATQDTVIDAYRVECASADMQGLLSSTYIAGYRIGMIVAGAGGLFMAQYLGSTKEVYSFSAWSNTYLLMASLMGVGIITCLLISEPEQKAQRRDYSSVDYARFLLLFLLIVAAFISAYAFSAGLSSEFKKSLNELLHNKSIASVLIETLRLGLALVCALACSYIFIGLGIAKKDMVEQTYIAPVKDFFARYGVQVAWLLLALVGLYRISDIVMGVIANVFYQDMGFSKADIAGASKTYGLLMTIAGGFLGGLLSVRFGVMKILWLGAILSALTNLLFMLFSQDGNPQLWMLYGVISADNLAGGLASAAFVAFLASLINVSFTAVQYAIFTSLMTLLPKMLGGYSGSMVDSIGYDYFFLLTALMSIPVLWLIYLAQKKLEINKNET